MSDQVKAKQAQSEWKKAVNWFYSDEEINTKETQKLNTLWEKAQPLTDKELFTVRQITSLSRCNWNLELSIQSLIEAIGKGEEAKIRIGHNYSITNDRWKKAWAYYFTVKSWLPIQGKYTGIPVLMDFCDPNKTIRSHILNLLGKNTKLKELYVELFSYSLEFHLLGRHPDDKAKISAIKAAVDSLINEVTKNDHDKMILAAVQINPAEPSEGKLRWYEVCHHKFFRRCDVILSSIGKNKWRGKFEEKSSEKKDLQELLLNFSLTLESWISNHYINDEFTKKIIELLGEHTSKKLFQVNLLNAFLKGQRETIRQKRY